MGKHWKVPFWIRKRTLNSGKNSEKQRLDKTKIQPVRGIYNRINMVLLTLTSRHVCENLN
ncbi:hypothetical protein P5673_020198 [Acropora cervicornis]|uniref:Uncharacterized protein n=1 Tax=Acropora cervicornis TaxID=6130 RepID=A0AAD9V1N7_ACRCE|nr:hypothetical protein P5673_020198 [Acropora cervicornis]